MYIFKQTGETDSRTVIIAVTVSTVRKKKKSKKHITLPRKGNEDFQGVVVLELIFES